MLFDFIEPDVRPTAVEPNVPSQASIRGCFGRWCDVHDVLSRKLTQHRLLLGLLLGPLAILITLRLIPPLDLEFFALTVHLVLMTAIAICSLVVAVVVARASMAVRQPRLVLMAAACVAVGILLLGHGLTTPNTLGQPANLWGSRFSYLALTLFSLLLGTASVFGSKPALQPLGRHAGPVLVGVTVPLVILVTAVVVDPTILRGTSSLHHESTLKSVAAFGSTAVLLPVSWSYWRRFRLSLDIVHASLAIAGATTAVAFMSMHFGEPWRLSWWDYHGCLLAGFAGVAYAVISRRRSATTAAAVLEHAFEDDPMALIATNYPEALRTLVDAIEVKDAYTSGHSARTAALAVAIGVRMGLDADTLRTLAQGAYLHDIGKLGIPDEILNKPGRLDDAERKVINNHPQIGCDIAAAHHVLEPCLPIIRHHHERIDGTGYPDGLHGHDIPLLARITAVADVWDALVTDRAYRPGWEPQQALDHIVEGAGTHLDLRAVAVLLDIAAESGITPSNTPVDPSALVDAAGDCHDAGAAPAGGIELIKPVLDRLVRTASD